MTNKKGVITLLLSTVGASWVFLVGMYLAVRAWHHLSYSLLSMLWTIPSYALMLAAYFYIGKINRMAKKRKNSLNN